METSLIVLKRKSLLGIIFDLILYFIIAVTLILFILSMIIVVKKIIFPDKIPDLFGIKPFIVLTDSMNDIIYSGDLVFVKECDVSSLKIGDIIAFRYSKDDLIIIHRITSIDNNSTTFYTKGDNNAQEDRLTISTENIEGIYSKRIPKVGRIAMFIKTPAGIVISIFVILTIFLIWQLLKSKKHEKIISRRLNECTEALLEIKNI